MFSNHVWCRPCNAAYATARRRRAGIAPAHRRQTDSEGRWQCASCKEWVHEAGMSAAKGRVLSYCVPCRDKRALVWRLKNRYGLSLDDYLAMIADQGARCATCREPLTGGLQTCVDHCHETGIVRGVLCMTCNRSLGLARECPARLRALADYVENRGR